MPMFTLKAAAAQLPKLIARAEAGEGIIIARGTKPVAMIVSIQSKPRAKRQFGSSLRITQGFSSTRAIFMSASVEAVKRAGVGVENPIDHALLDLAVVL